ncbi:glycerol-3-phosphate acyltransferase [Psychromonas ingrahamii 37]|uniref:Glycerol-3-phosphate acyltransferase n=1 Tax=Psychromonas ingrahamii (strain DSM 17664 / CCUG 51855 / 37) TaxID=357804 RepID=A1SRE7_PSYIN|nr:glycerol-3-phosphate 1-O-acyltransferase PlsB [Psychromonas ingrahamii]ABM02062.1 glycerol-3-phosphate acyltransferase [Psychromonas ingrahamii 37]
MLVKGSIFHRVINKYWVSNHYVPVNPVAELQLDLSRPIIYLVAQNCASDLLALQSCCLQAGLPDPYRPINVDQENLSATIFIDDSVLSSPKAQLQDAAYLRQYQQLLTLHRRLPNLNIQLLPVTFYWGRNPGKQGRRSCFDRVEQRSVGSLHKIGIVLKNGKDHLLRFNKPISIAALRHRLDPQKSDQQKNSDSKQSANKLAKIALTYFANQKRYSIGPKLPNRSAMIEAVLQQPLLRKTIRTAALREQCSEQQVDRQCRKYLLEISANFSYPLLRVFRLILKGLWNHLYRGIEVNHAEAVRQANQSGAEIIYLPCHRSHMDYLLLSYLLVEQGLVAPHVAAGVNLSFFPLGPIFRRSGAFFLRRTFKGAPLYAAIFNAYFSMLFKQGYPIEFFSEGGRSRTGRLLPPKTGLLATTLQTYLNQPERNVILVPIYIGYDHIMEVNTYIKELSGQKKEKESVWQLLAAVKQLGNFGRVFVNFGVPINIKKHFDQQTPNWQKAGVDDRQFKIQVQQVARQVMVGINQATAVSALPLCAAILLASKNFQSKKTVFLALLDKHQQLLGLKSENSSLTYAKEKNCLVYRQALSMNKFEQDGERVFCSKNQAMQLNYYRNNIVHVFALPSLVCHVLGYLMRINKTLSFDNIIYYGAKVYPFLAADYFLKIPVNIALLLENELSQLRAIGVFKFEKGRYSVVDAVLFNVLAQHLQETFLRYQQLFVLLLSCKYWSNVDHRAICVQAKENCQPSSIDFFDEKVTHVFLQTMQNEYPDFVTQEQGEILQDLFAPFCSIDLQPIEKEKKC